ncbi:MAG: ABC transporter permease, partial [Verrucomicrobiota bacterium]
MAEKSSDEIKYRILRFIDVTGFTVFDPMVRLAFGEDPQKQIKHIVQFFIIPIIFLCACVWLWWVVAPNHKTKSGEVPTPDIIVQSAVINDTFSDREKTKESDFLLVGEERVAALAEVESMIMENETILEELKTALAG